MSPAHGLFPTGATWEAHNTQGAVAAAAAAAKPENFERLRANIEAILPAHVGIEYAFHYLTWAVLESRKWKFQDIEGMTWDELEKSV